MNSSPGIVGSDEPGDKSSPAETRTPRRVLGFAPSSTCSTPPPSVFDGGDEQQLSPFGQAMNDEEMTSGFASIQVSQPPSPLSRQASALTTELQNHPFESAMYRLKSLRTPNDDRSGKVPGAMAKRAERGGSQHLVSRSHSLSSSAMAIPLSSRARTAPDQLPELTESMIEKLLAKMDGSPDETSEQGKRNGNGKSNGKSNGNGKSNNKSKNTTTASNKSKTPDVTELCPPQRRRNGAGKRVPSSAFLNDLNSLKVRQESMNFGEVQSTRKNNNRNRSP